MPTVDPVILKLEADLADYNRGVQQAQRMTEQRLGGIQASADRMGAGVSKAFNLAKIAALAFVTARGLGAIKDAITSGLEYAASMGEISAQAGVTTDALQEYIYAGTQVNLSQADVVQGLEQLNRRLGEAATGTGTTGRALARLGVDLRGANGEVKNAAEIIPEIAEAMKSVSSEAEKGALRQELFGRSGQKMAALLADGASGVNNLRDAAHKLGIVLSAKQIADADKTADKLEALKTVLSARIAGAVADNVGAIDSLISAMERLINAAGRAIPQMQRFGLEMSARYADAQAKTHALSPWAHMRAKVPGFIAESEALRKQAAGVGAQAPTGGIRGGLAALTQFGRSQVAGGNYDYDPEAGASTKAAKATGAVGPSAEDLARAFRESAIEIEALAAEYQLAHARLTGNISDRAEAEKALVDAGLAREIERINADKLLTDARKVQLTAANQQIAEAERQLIDQRARKDIADELRDQMRKELDAMRDAEDRRAEIAQYEIDAVDAEAAFADTLRQRNEMERRLLALQQQEERDRLEAAIAMGQVADAAKARAALDRRQAAEQRGLEQDQEGPAARYMRFLRDDAENLSDAYEDVAVRGLMRLEDSLARATSNALGLHGVLGDIIGDLIQIGIRRAIIGPLADALFGGAGGGAGGAVGGILSGLFGRASGGYVAPGQMVRVNEGTGRSEAFMSRDGGKIIPLGQTNAARQPQQTIVHQTFVLDARYGITTPQLLEHVNRTAQQAAVQVGAGFGQAIVKGIPARMAQYQKDGT